MIGVIKSDFYRFFINKKFFFSLVAIFASFFLSLENEMINLLHSTDVDVVSYFDFVLETGAFRNLVFFFSGAVCSASFYDDMINKNINSILIRAGIRKYAISRFIISELACICSVICGVMIFTAVLSFFVPVYDQNCSDTAMDFSFGVLVNTTSPLVYLIVKSFNLALCCSFFTHLAITVSSIYMDKLFTLTSPFFGWYFLSEVTDVLPVNLRIRALAYSYNIMNQKFLITESYILVFWTVLSVLLLISFEKNINRRMEKSIDK